MAVTRARPDRIFAAQALPTLVAAALVFGLVACASSPGASDSGRFETDVKDNGIRLFRYIQPLQRDQPRPINSLAAAEENARRRELYDPQNQIELARRLLERDTRLKAFCPDGHVIIEQYAVLSDIVIRGECRYESTAASHKAR